MYRTSDGGKAWRRVGAPDDLVLAGHSRGGAISAIDFVNPRVGFALGGDLWRTTDAGRTWHRLPLPPWRIKDRTVGEPMVTSAVVSGSVAYLVGTVCNTAGQQCEFGALYQAAASGGVRRVSDLPVLGMPGGFFSGALSGDRGMTFFSVNATPGRPRLYARDSQGWVRRHDPCGRGSESEGVVADRPALIDLCDGYQGQDRGARSLAFRSLDGGASWLRSGEVGFAKAPSTVTRVGTDLYVADDEAGGHVYRSVDSGRRWVILRTLPRSADGWSSLDFPSLREGFAIAAGPHGKLLSTIDGGFNWHQVDLL